MSGSTPDPSPPEIDVDPELLARLVAWLVDVALETCAAGEFDAAA